MDETLFGLDATPAVLTPDPSRTLLAESDGRHPGRAAGRRRPGHPAARASAMP